MDRIIELEKITKDYFIESHEFLFTKKFINRRKRSINLIFGAYNIEYNLVLKDYRIFFDNKLKTKFKFNTTLAQKVRHKKYNIGKYVLASKILKLDKIFGSNFDLKDITIRPNTNKTFRVSRRNKELYLRRFKIKRFNRKFFYTQALEIL